MDNKSEWWYRDFEEVLPSSEISDDDDRPVSSLHTRAKIRKMIEKIVAEAERRTWDEAGKLVAGAIAETASGEEYTHLIQFALSKLNPILHKIQAKLASLTNKKEV